MSTESIPSDNTSQYKAVSGDVIQVDPTSPVGKKLGSLFAIVDEAHEWGVLCHFFVARVDQQPGRSYLRVEHGNYVIIGRAEWLVRDESDEPAEK
jgi:hypothetical protein